MIQNQIQFSKNTSNQFVSISSTGQLHINHQYIVHHQILPNSHIHTYTVATQSIMCKLLQQVNTMKTFATVLFSTHSFIGIRIFVDYRCLQKFCIPSHTHTSLRNNIVPNHNTISIS